MSSNKDKKEQEPQTEEIKEEKVETAAEEIKEEAKTESKEEKTEKKHKKESKKEAEIKETAEKLIQAEKEKYLRLCAEYDNFRKRSQKERRPVRRYKGGHAAQIPSRLRQSGKSALHADVRRSVPQGRGNDDGAV